jgi:uncharacterized protein YodC (DUF2158 family)
METKTITKEFNQYEDFNVGDIVKLKSGGPNMTIDGHHGSQLLCIWFTDGHVQYRDFDQGAIEKVTKDPDLSPA